ncbi:MAG TPA: glycosyltransferase family 2 protein [Solirubrobacteraceae bacterium]|nr:glycosyltransferase family 2 protein [Solirubrobacteraceae bacterium]
MAPRLSICVPTNHGRALVLAAALDSILAQLPDCPTAVEIVVSDNASADASAEVVASRARRHPGLLAYRRNERDLGFAANLRAAVEHARGDFCWLLGSDDAITPGGLERVLRALRAEPSLTGLSFARENRDALLERPAFPDPPSLLPAVLAQERHYGALRPALQDLGLYLTYLSAHVTRRPELLDVLRDAPRQVVDPGHFLHLYAFSRLLAQRPDWRWLPERIVLNRTVNDTLVQALDGQVAAYQAVTQRDRARAWTQALGAEGEELSLLRHASRGHFASARAILGYKLGPSHTWREDVLLLRTFARGFAAVPAFWSASFPALLVPHRLAKLLRQQLRLRPV